MTAEKVLVRQPQASRASAEAPSVAEPQLLCVLAVLAARLQKRHPSASPAMIERSIDDAIQAFNNARIRQYLPILIERAASKTLHEASISHESAAPAPSPSRRIDL
jgi:hypothetical protein